MSRILSRSPPPWINLGFQVIFLTFPSLNWYFPSVSFWFATVWALSHEEGSKRWIYYRKWMNRNHKTMNCNFEENFTRIVNVNYIPWRPRALFCFPLTFCFSSFIPRRYCLCDNNLSMVVDIILWTRIVKLHYTENRNVCPFVGWFTKTFNCSPWTFLFHHLVVQWHGSRLPISFRGHDFTIRIRSCSFTFFGFFFFCRWSLSFLETLISHLNNQIATDKHGFWLSD